MALCPFTACGEYLNFAKLGEAKTIDEVLEFWDGFNKIVGPVNYGELMPRSKLMIAILDGGYNKRSFVMRSSSSGEADASKRLFAHVVEAACKELRVTYCYCSVLLIRTQLQCAVKKNK